MGSTRFFLSDLPFRTTESDLLSLFQDYGYVEHVDLKRKDQDEQQAVKVIAFVTLRTDDAHYCLNELNWQKLHGTKLKVSLAKESFLDRLKREREETQLKEQQPDHTEFNESSSHLLKQSTENKRRIFGEHEEIGDDEIAPELLITKKRAAHSIHNGKIVIQQEHDVNPLHVIENYRKPAKHQPKDGIVSKAEQKRKESLNKKRQDHQQKKSTIRIALTLEGTQSKRIKFSDAEEEEAKEKQSVNNAKQDLFASDQDDDDDANEEVLLPQYSGKKGERLVEMQSKQSLDARFRITANFVDDEEDENENDANDKPEHQESERNWQMGILEQVVGRKLTDETARKTDSKKKKMLRFDPGKEDHQKLVRQKPIQKAKTEEVEETVQAPDTSSTPASVSKSAFYMVTDTLKQSLNMRGVGFSLLDMFGSAHDEELAKRQGQLEKLSNEKILVNKLNANKPDLLASINPFSYDSSDSENDDGNVEDENKPAQPQANENEASKKSKSIKKKANKMQMESFFIPKNDPRLKEGAKFFKVSKAEIMGHADYDQVKSRLKLLITNKIAKTKKNLPAKDMMKNRHKLSRKQTKNNK